MSIVSSWDVSMLPMTNPPGWMYTSPGRSPSRSAGAKIRTGTSGEPSAPGTVMSRTSTGTGGTYCGSPNNSASAARTCSTSAIVSCGIDEIHGTSSGS